MNINSNFIKSIETNYISSACNQLSHAADWGRNNLVCYAANHAIVVYNPQANNFGLVLSTLHKHTDRVNIVRWIRPNFPKLESEFISASSDGTVIIWSAENLATGCFKTTNILRINEPTNMCDAIYISSNLCDLLVCTGSINGNIKLWIKVGNQAIESKQIFNIAKKLPIEARLVFLTNKFENNRNPLLILAMEDSTILLYVVKLNIDDSNKNKIEEVKKVQTLIGHEDWITSIDYMLTDFQNLFIATGSQDNTIRVWKITYSTNTYTDCIKSENLKSKQKHFFIHDQEYEITLETILNSHDSWVYEVNWHPPIKINNTYFQPMKLLSCSIDKTVIIWELNINTGIWFDAVRIGQVGGNNSLGFYGCKFNPYGNNFLTYDYNGIFHIWKYQKESKDWQPRTAPTGHSNKVVDLCWDPKGRFLITASIDRTTRIHAPWFQNGKEVWYEVGRPQIHGYDMSCLAIVKPYMFASGAEEKVIRIFTAPLIFKKFLKNITNDISDFDISDITQGASVPALGLTNKAILYKDSLNENLCNDKLKNSCLKINYEEPPAEEYLIQSTLWPEWQKLYGHGFEIYSMTSRHDGTLLATASKSTSLEHAAIILWNTKTWCQSQKLFSHQLTITQLAFSFNDIYLLSVSRDRHWSLFSCTNLKYELIISSCKNSFHSRIIWCCAWTFDSNYFATGSRDGKIGIWSKTINIGVQPVPITSLCLTNNSVTALAFAPFNDKNTFDYILAIGYETGCIDIRKILPNNNKTLYDWIQIAFINSSNAHHLTITRLAFRPKHAQQKNILQLASCGFDSFIKIHGIALN